MEKVFVVRGGKLTFALRFASGSNRGLYADGKDAGSDFVNAHLWGSAIDAIKWARARGYALLDACRPADVCAAYAGVYGVECNSTGASWCNLAGMRVRLSSIRERLRMIDKV